MRNYAAKCGFKVWNASAGMQSIWGLPMPCVILWHELIIIVRNKQNEENILSKEWKLYFWMCCNSEVSKISESKSPCSTETIKKEKNPRSITNLQMAYYYQTCNFHKAVMKHNLILLSHQLTLYYRFIHAIWSLELLRGLNMTLGLRCQQWSVSAILTSQGSIAMWVLLIWSQEGRIKNDVPSKQKSHCLHTSCVVLLCNNTSLHSLLPNVFTHFFFAALV